ncbi:hypothetical protein F4809DRAFT_597490 [Biscogniauxia mediterranea]|nr:hypothetical protein F4809DRAFT_597490 [Biscogniauxia mediterranea]
MSLWICIYIHWVFLSSPPLQSPYFRVPPLRRGVLTLVVFLFCRVIKFIRKGHTNRTKGRKILGIGVWLYTSRYRKI